MAVLTNLFHAAWVFPISGPPIRDGAIHVHGGTIEGIGPFDQMHDLHPDAKVIDRGACTILPGLVNAHTHLELSEFTCVPKPPNFTQWLTRLIPRGQATATSVRESVERSVPIGMKQCLKFGVTSVGDISRHCTISRPILRRKPLRVVSFGEVQAMAQRRGLLDERIATATDPEFAESNHLTIGLSPHAPYSIEAEGYRRCVEVANSRNMPLATHLAETPDEATFLADHTGPFRDLWTYIGAWDENVPRFAGGPVRFAQAVGMLDYPTLLAHVNYCDDDEMEFLARSPASVVYCPRTHAYFRHPPHRWREMMARGINVALGTDSCASSPDLNLLEEMRIIRRIAPDLDPSVIWEMATLNGAKALQMSGPACRPKGDRADDINTAMTVMFGTAGSLEIGKRADMVVFKTETNDPLREILDENLLPRETYICGNKCSP